MVIDDNIPDRDRLIIAQLFEGDLGFHFIESYREVGIGEHISEELFCIFFKPDGGPNHDITRFLIERAKEGESCDMVPVRMRDEEVNGVVIFDLNGVTELSYSRSCINDDEIVVMADF